MTAAGPDTGPEKAPGKGGTPRGVPLWANAAAAGVLLCAALAGMVYLGRLYPVGLGPRQPIPFSHRVHAGIKQIGCFMCHDSATRSSRAGIPPLQTCLLCHARIIRTYPYIARLRELAARNQPVVWQRVNWVPEFVYFDHSMHLRRGVDCGHCHGDIRQMDRVAGAVKFEMGFCIQCHRDNRVTHDCFVCHR
ncbi:cytochrome c3 family protein [Geomonas diazotrophica]|uniref:cytochrome c3 family protein n=1 Tax=Geomonas diazotrophica TaxID=2843197 RepID=UPI001EF16CB0|nr:MULTISPECIES: cytochrome c3 family protein [Geomonas]